MTYDCGKPLRNDIIGSYFCNKYNIMKYLSDDAIYYCALNVYRRHLKGLDNLEVRHQYMIKRIDVLKEELMNKPNP